MQPTPKLARLLRLSASAIILVILAAVLGCQARDPIATSPADLPGNPLVAATSLAKPAPATATATKTRVAKASATVPPATGEATQPVQSMTATAATPPPTTSADTPTAQVATATQAPLPTATATTSSPADQPTSTQPAPTATTTPTPTATSPSNPNSVLLTGKLLRDGAAAGGIVTLLEAGQVITTTTDASGIYTFTAQIADRSFSVTFSQEANPALRSDNQVASWAWLEGYIPSGISRLEMPEMDISLVLGGQKFEQRSPAANASISGGNISRQNPLRFEWSTYPQSLGYWVDLGKENEVTTVWQSYFTSNPSFNFSGLLGNGAAISPGNYWWNIGMQKQLGVYTFTVYGHPWSLVITP